MASERHDPKPPSGPRPDCHENCGPMQIPGVRKEDITCRCGEGYYDRQDCFVHGSDVRAGNAPSKEKYYKLTAEPLWSFIPEEDINVHALAFYLQEFIDRTAQLRPGAHWKNKEQFGYWIHARRTLSSENILDIKLDSRDWAKETKKSNCTYINSIVAKKRKEFGPTESTRYSSNKGSNDGTPIQATQRPSSSANPLEQPGSAMRHAPSQIPSVAIKTPMSGAGRHALAASTSPPPPYQRDNVEFDAGAMCFEAGRGRHEPMQPLPPFPQQAAKLSGYQLAARSGGQPYTTQSMQAIPMTAVSAEGPQTAQQRPRDREDVGGMRDEDGTEKDSYRRGDERKRRDSGRGEMPMRGWKR